MDHFESIVKALLEQEGYWVRNSFKVNLTKSEKRRIGRPSIPRPEIDLLAYKPESGELLELEAKSFFDSAGANPDHLKFKFSAPEGRYKLFTCSNYRSIVLKRLKADLLEIGLAIENSKLKLGLAAGKVYQSRSNEVSLYFKSKKWFFLSPESIRQGLVSFSSMGYENDSVVIASKILMRV